MLNDDILSKEWTLTNDEFIHGHQNSFSKLWFHLLEVFNKSIGIL